MPDPARHDRRALRCAPPPAYVGRSTHRGIPMKIRLLPAALALALLPAAVLNAPAAHADEGMWQPSQMPELGDRLRERGLRMDPAPLSLPVSKRPVAVVDRG